MLLLIANMIGIITLWAFSYVGIRQYEYAQQDGSTGTMKMFVHLLTLGLLTANIYSFISSERSTIVHNTPMVEEIKK